MTIILPNLNRFRKFTERFLAKFAVKCIFKIPPHLAYIVTLPCETLVSAKQVINYKLQGSVATYLRFRWVVNNQIKKSLLLSVRVKKNQKVNIWQSYKLERDCLVHLTKTLQKDGKRRRSILIFFHSQTQQ